MPRLAAAPRVVAGNLPAVLLVGAGLWPFGCGGDERSAADAAPRADAADAGSSADRDASGGGDASPGADVTVGAPALDEAFGSDGPWPAVWQSLGGIASAAVVGGRGQLTPELSSYSLARVGRPVDLTDAEAVYTIVLHDPAWQGVGVYLRHNLGYLARSTPSGAGYGAFVEAFRGSKLGVWRERMGQEQEIRSVDLPFALAADTPYGVRFRCRQLTRTTTLLEARVWPAAQAEPSDWMVSAIDDSPELQNTSGALVIDAWNNAMPGTGPAPRPISIDDITVRPIGP